MEATDAKPGGDPSAELRASWFDWDRAGALTRFVETRYAGEATERAWRERLGTERVTAHPMTLREVFMSLARAGRAAAKEKVS